MIAHIDCITGREQSLYEHCWNVSNLCRQLAAPIHMSATAGLIGLIHDMGKASEKWQRYLRVSSGSEEGHVSRGSVYHSPIGAIFAYNRWFLPNSEREIKISAQILMMTVYGHHSGLMDVISSDGQLQLLTRMEQALEIDYDEAVFNYIKNVCSLSELDALFLEAVQEIKVFLEKLKDPTFTDKAFIRGLLTKELFGILIDADRWDSACFTYGTNSLQTEDCPDWSGALNNLNLFLTGMDHSGAVNQIRKRISDECEQAAEAKGSLFRLSVPTGGGKTFASLRFALKYAALHSYDTKRIFYIIPFNTILDQNAKDIRGVIGEKIRILEHHSNVVYEGENAYEENENHRLLTERWDSDLILTSMVQFLNCFYTAANSDARRIPHLSGSILIFDEIQSLPKKCTRLFEQAIDFLTEFCGCTVVLCTATQPALRFHSSPLEMISDVPTLFRDLKRTRLIDEASTAYSFFEASDRIADLMANYGSVLMIVNTKEAAREMAALIKERGFPTAHLSTDMVPAHRIRVIESIRKRDVKKPLFCVSTALIEAGINISFPCVVRSLTGLGSILQAAGRCNRNGELGEGKYGDVYIWKLGEERLTKLPEIQKAQQVTYGILNSEFIPDSPEGIERYFRNERKEFQELTDYPVNNPKAVLTDLFGKNNTYRSLVKDEQDLRLFPIPGAFRTVGENFNVIDAQTRSVIVPYEKGKEIITELCSVRDLERMISLLRESQQYSVSVYENRFSDYCRNGRIRYDENSGVFILLEEYYNNETGLTDTPSATEFLEI